MRTNNWLFSFVLLVLIFLPTLSIAETDLGKDNSITIVKYKMSDEFLKSNPHTLDGTEIESMRDEKGNSLEPIENISYLIERVTPDSNKTGFKLVTGMNSFKVQLVTNKFGVAEFNQLESGMYRVTEEKNLRVEKVMEPVILELPLPRANGESLKHVFIYPKSSVLESNIIKEVDNNNQSDNLPKTSGNMGTPSSIFWLMSLVLCFGLVGTFIMYRKKDVV